MAAASLNSVALCGSGLSLWMTAVALSHRLPDTIAITVVETGPNPLDDMFYGHILPPSAYGFHLSIGLSEPELLLNSGTTFVYGTHFENWANTGRSWVQAFHQPLPVWDGIPFAKLMAQQTDRSLQSSLISAQAAVSGVFAHPSEDPNHPLSRAEYGYAFDPQHLSAIYKALTMRRSITLLSAQLESVQRDGDNIKAVTLSNGQSLSSDLFIDCTGPVARLGCEADPASAPAQPSESKAARTVYAALSRAPSAPLGKAALTVKSDEAGWTSNVCLRTGSQSLSVTHAPTTDASEATVALTIGRAARAWRGNCVAIGHAAHRIEPLTTAPMKLLLRDVDRLIKLFPIAHDMTIEAQAYNRLHHADYDHASLFNQALFAIPTAPNSPYWRGACADTDSPKLVRKLTQYESRGHITAFDNEPFDDVDWAILHDGMGRKPRRRDPLANLLDPATLQSRIDAQHNAIQTTIQKMPPHPIYMKKFMSYLTRKYSRNG